MARHKKFDQEEVLEKAMITFWRHGFEGTSIQDLVNTMGINRGSLYDTFGDKRSLFVAAIILYENTIFKRMIACLEVPNASKPAIKELFYSIVEGSLEDKEFRGCFLTNTAIELCPQDEEVVKLIRADVQLFENSLKKVLVKAQEKKEISPAKNVDNLAQYFVSSLQGLRVISKVGLEPQFLYNVVGIILSVLD